MAKVPKKLCAFRLNEQAILTIAKLAVLRECSQSEAIEYALGSDAGLPLRLSSKLKVASSEGEREDRDPIRIDELYSTPEATTPELEVGLRLLGEAIRYSQTAIKAYEEGNVIVADDATLNIQALMPELFCCRNLGEGFGSVINALMSALQALEGTPATPGQLQAVANALANLRRIPFLDVNRAIDEITNLEESGLSVDPAGFEEFVSGVFNDESIRWH